MELPTLEDKDKISIQGFEDILQHRYLEYRNNFATVQLCSSKQGEPVLTFALLRLQLSGFVTV